MMFCSIYLLRSKSETTYCSKTAQWINEQLLIVQPESDCTGLIIVRYFVFIHNNISAIGPLSVSLPYAYHWTMFLVLYYAFFSLPLSSFFSQDPSACLIMYYAWTVIKEVERSICSLPSLLIFGTFWSPLSPLLVPNEWFSIPFSFQKTLS